ncbi:MAG: orotate phosphoribosyltransferase [Bacteroidales bacterium]|nr:orotate phosphoribosyltransferase [Bacteroidales bacterium]
MNEIIAKLLLSVNAVKLNIENPFLWASGWKSPIYCDNRKTYYYPNVRKEIINGYLNLIDSYFKNVEVIAAVATGAIGYGSIIADKLNLPLVYVRTEAKSHGLGNLIEGEVPKNKKVVVIEDLISTGKSSVSVIKTLKSFNADVIGLIAIFTYNFDIADNCFKEENIKYYTLTDYFSLIKVSLELKYISENQLQSLNEWRKSPQTWGT